MLFRLAVDEQPAQHPDDAQRADEHEHQLPAEGQQERRGDGRCDGEAHLCSGDVDAGGAGLLMVGEPLVGRLDRAGEQRCFGHAEDHPQPEEGGDVAGEAGGRTGDRPQQCCHGHQDFRAEAVDRPARGQVHDRVGPDERREDHSHLGGAEAQVVPDHRRGDRQVPAIQVAGDRQYGDRGDDRPADVASPGPAWWRSLLRGGGLAASALYCHNVTSLCVCPVQAAWLKMDDKMSSVTSRRKCRCPRGGLSTGRWIVAEIGRPGRMIVKPFYGAP